MAPKTTAEREGYTVLTDAELRTATETRVRQLEQELAGHKIFLAEVQADPHDDASAEQIQRTIETLEAKLAVTRQRLAALRENTGEG